MTPRFTFMNLLAGLAILPLTAVGADACLHKVDGGSGMALGGAVRTLESQESARFPGTLEIACQNSSIDRIDVTLPAGTGRGLGLIVGRRDGRIPRPQIADATGWASLAVEKTPDSSNIRLKVSFFAPEDAEEGEVFSGSLMLFNPSSRNGESPLSIPLKLTIRGEAPLFRDKFDVDPVIGQFSLVTH